MHRLHSILLLSLVAAGRPSPVSIDPGQLTVVHGRATAERYQGREATRLSPLPGHEFDDGDILAVVTSTHFRDGTLEVDVAGTPRPDAPPQMKGFIGLMFRLSSSADGGEMIYLRPVNGRSSNQLERNHAVQYVSPPEYSWQRLRKESPGMYESYVDLEPGVWTHMKIEVSGTQARLYVAGAEQPCLVVNDLKRGDSTGAIGLWAHATTVAYFSNLLIRARP